MKKIISFFLLILISSSIFALTENTITVMDFTADHDSEAVKELVTDYIGSLVDSDSEYNLLNSIDKAFMMKELAITSEDYSNKNGLLALAKLLSVDYFIAGDLKNNNGLDISMSIVDVRTGREVRSISNSYSNLDALLRDSELLANRLLGNAQAVARTEAAKQPVKPLRSRVYGSERKYTYDRKEYVWGAFPELAEKLAEAMPESPEILVFKDQVKSARISDNILAYGGAGVAISGVPMILLNMDDGDMTTLSWIGAGMIGVGIICEMIGVFSESDIPIMTKMTSYYNANL